MRWHRVSDADLGEVFALNPRHVGAGDVGPERALEAWRWLLRCPSFAGNVFQDDRARPEGRVVGAGTAVFVQSCFAEHELAEPRPGLNDRIISSIVERAPVTLTYEQLGKANARGNLNLAVLTGAFSDRLREEELWEAITVMSSVFVASYTGYNIERILYEAIGSMEVKIHTATSISRIIKRFDEQRVLLVNTPESAASVTGSQIGPLFLKRRPLLRLSQAEQDLLLAALDELTDDDLSTRLITHVGTIKKRWTRIFERFASVLSELVSDGHGSNDDHQRGKQKRHRVLAYVREHPEELRPYDYDAEAQALDGAEVR